jgi:hypothetical protein
VKNVTLLTLALTMLSAHAVGADEMNATTTQKNEIQVAPITFQNEALVEKAIVTDCDLPTIQFNELNKFSSKFGIALSLPTQEANTSGRVLQIQIANAIASGNAFIGHHKQLTLVGKLLENGTEVASFSAMRSSGGGAFAGFKGSCSVLHRCATTLGKDVGEWLRSPVPNARLGELK